MWKKPLFRILLFSLTILGMGVDHSSVYMDKGALNTLSYCDTEQDQEENNCESKSAKGDKYRPSSDGMPAALNRPGPLQRCQIPVFSDGVFPPTFLPIFTPPPENA